MEGMDATTRSSLSQLKFQRNEEREEKKKRDMRSRVNANGILQARIFYRFQPRVNERKTVQSKVASFTAGEKRDMRSRLNANASQSRGEGAIDSR